MSYTARRVEASDAEREVLALWRANRPEHDHAHLAELYRWYYLDHPIAAGTSFVLDKTAPGGAATTCGSLGVAERAFRIGGDARRVALLGDLVVSRGHRSLFPALTLERAARDWAAPTFDLIYGFPNEAARASFLRLGFHEPHVPRYVSLLSAERFLRKRLGRLPSDVLSFAANRAFRWLTPVLPRSLGVTWLPSFDGRFDRLWERAASSFPIACRRDARFLRWRFAEKPKDRFEIAALVERGSGHLCGYAVVQEDGEIARVRDALARGPDEMVHLFSTLRRELLAKGYSSLSFHLLAGEVMGECLFAAGLVPRELGRAVVLSRGESCRFDAAFVREPKHWYMTEADEDQ